MIHSVRLALILLMIVPVTSGRGEASDVALASTVLVTAPTPNGTAYAAGVIVREDTNLFVLTARHVAETKNLTIVTSAGERIRVQNVQFLPGRDLALLQTTAALRRYSTPRLAAATQSERDIYLWGFPESTTPTRSVGSILNLSPIIPDGEANGRFTIACESCNHGDSGSGVFTNDGRLVGILTAAWKNQVGVVRMIVAEPALAALSALAPQAVTASR